MTMTTVMMLADAGGRDDHGDGDGGDVGEDAMFAMVR